MLGAQGQRNEEKALPSVIAPGNYDGVHLGHRALLRSARAHAVAHGLRTAALTFDPHPLSVLDPARAPGMLTTQRRRAELLRAVGADDVIVQRFDRAYAALPPEAFIEVLCDKGAKALVVGPDFRFGQKRAGDVRLLQTLGARHGLSVLIEEPVLLAGTRVSSTAIRNALSAGDVAGASRMLGRVHELDGSVIKGDQRGRTLGFPTANLAPDAVLPPADGVYAVVARDLSQPPSKLLLGVANLGSRPTFAAGRSLEVHIFDLDADLYDHTLRVGFVERIRGELRFAGLEELKRQIEADCVRARELLQARDEELVAWI